MRLKTKLSLGTGFLFIAILISGILGIISIRQLKNDAEQVLENNYETLVYNTNMLYALEALPQDSTARKVFEENLSGQLANITEPGEASFTANLRMAYEGLFVRQLHGFTQGHYPERVGEHQQSEPERYFPEEPGYGTQR